MRSKIIRLRIEDIRPTVFLKRRPGRPGGGSGLAQLIRVTLVNDGPPTEGFLETGGVKTSLPVIPAGRSDYDVFCDEVTAPTEVNVTLKSGAPALEEKRILLKPVRHWTVHVVQLSHHDVGYTDLPSAVIPQHDTWLDNVIEYARATRLWPEEAQFRIVVEQAWSIAHYFKTAAPRRAAAMKRLMRSGHVELTALFGNMTTELCGPEALARCVYPAFRLKHELGIPLIAAEHNDVPGFTWGLAQVLSSAGIKLLAAGLPRYYDWGSQRIPSFWDEAAIFGETGIPGAFWWEAPDGQRILFWHNGQCGGDCRTNLPQLAGRLLELESTGYPGAALRWTVIGGARDNSPYLPGYAATIRAWNRQWEFPRLISSTNALFYRDLSVRLPASIPVMRGDIPGQDYPAGASSTAGPTAINRRTHDELPAAETQAVMASALVPTTRKDGGDYPVDRLASACEAMLFHDEHTWGYHFPCGPAAQAGEQEKALHAYHAAAWTHEIAGKAMARIADAVRLKPEGLHLVVFNPTPQRRTDLVAAPLREFDNTGSEMIAVPPAGGSDQCGYLRGALLGTRWHVNPPPEIVAGCFDLIDVISGKAISFQIAELDSALDAAPYAAQRLGLAAGGKRYGFFELPLGLKRELRFLAADVPPLGYRTYRLAPRNPPAVGASFAARVIASPHILENRYYRLAVNPKTGFITELFDKETGRNFIDPAARHPFGALIVHDSQGHETLDCAEGIAAVESGAVCGTLKISAHAPGHPRLLRTITLYADLKRIDFALHVLKGPEPLLETHLAFPFAFADGRFSYESTLYAGGPDSLQGRDRMPGAFANRLTAQHWVKVSDGRYHALWSPLDAPVISLGKLWPARVSPAHACIQSLDMAAPPQTPEDLRGGAIYSCLFANNFGTNFSVSQTGAVLFRYTLTTGANDPDAAAAAAWGERAALPLRQIFTKHPGRRTLPPSQAFLEITNASIRLLALKRAEDGRGLILRLWNPAPRAERTRVKFPQRKVQKVMCANLAEEDTGKKVAHAQHGFELTIPTRAVVTLRIA